MLRIVIFLGFQLIVLNQLTASSEEDDTQFKLDVSSIPIPAKARMTQVLQKSYSAPERVSIGEIEISTSEGSREGSRKKALSDLHIAVEEDSSEGIFHMDPFVPKNPRISIEDLSYSSAEKGAVGAKTKENLVDVIAKLLKDSTSEESESPFRNQDVDELIASLLMPVSEEDNPHPETLKAIEEAKVEYKDILSKRTLEAHKRAKRNKQMYGIRRLSQSDGSIMDQLYAPVASPRVKSARKNYSPRTPIFGRKRSSTRNASGSGSPRSLKEFFKGIKSKKDSPRTSYKK